MISSIKVFAQLYICVWVERGNKSILRRAKANTLGCKAKE